MLYMHWTHALRPADTGGMTISSFDKLVTAIREHREARLLRRQLEADLSVYSTPAEINDLLAALDRDDSAESEMMRQILSDNLVSFHRLQAA